MAGYRREKKVYRLRFDPDTDLAGLEVRAKSVPVGTFLELSALVDPASDDVGGQVDRVSRLFAAFADQLISWNLEDEDGSPVPATLAGLRDQEFEFVLAIITAWMEAISGTDTPLPKPSSGGTTTLEVSLPMVPLSPSPEPSPALS